MVNTEQQQQNGVTGAEQQQNGVTGAEQQQNGTTEDEQQQRKPTEVQLQDIALKALRHVLFAVIICSHSVRL